MVTESAVQPEPVAAGAEIPIVGHTVTVEGVDLKCEQAQFGVREVGSNRPLVMYTVDEQRSVAFIYNTAGSSDMQITAATLAECVKKVEAIRAVL